MSVLAVRACETCQLWRYAPCSPVCRADDPQEPKNWQTFTFPDRPKA